MKYLTANKLILALSFLFLHLIVLGQKAEDEKTYLIDNLILEELTQEDQKIIKEGIKDYHSAKHDTSRIEALRIIIRTLNSHYWEDYQIVQYDLIRSALKKKYTKEVKERLSNQLAEASNNMGIVYGNKGDLAKSLEIYSQAVLVYEKENKDEELATTLHNIGSIHSSLDHDSLALKYLIRASRINDRIGNVDGYVGNLHKIGSIYLDSGNYEKAKSFFDEELIICKRIDIDSYTSLALEDVGKVLFEMSKGDFTQKDSLQTAAIDCFKESVELAQSIKIDDQTASSSVSLASALHYQGDIINALSFGQRALELAKKLNRPKLLKSSARVLCSIYTEMGDYQMALKMNQLYFEMSNKINSSNNKKSAVMMEANFTFEKEQELLKEKHHHRIIEKEKQHEINTAKIENARLQNRNLVIAISLLSLLAVIAFRAYRQKKRDTAIIVNEKERSEKLLLNILPEEVAKDLKQHGKAKAKRYDSVSVLFTDFVGFTKISEQLTAEELVDEIDFCYKKFDEILDKYNVEKIKTIGDAYMCVGGLPTKNNSHPKDIINVALDICDFIVSYSKEKQALNEQSFNIRIGVHTGSVVAGVVGTKKFAYDIWGDTVNVASRMESNSETNKVNVSSATFELVKHDFDCTYRGEIDVKNKGAMGMYFVERLQS